MKSPRALGCPKCGGTLAPPLAERRLSCGFCGQALYYAAEEFLPTLALEPEVSEAAVRARVLRLFKSPYLPRDLASRALLLQSRRSFLPFYLLTGKRGGVLTAGRERIVRRWRPDLEHSADMGGPAARAYRTSKVDTVWEEDARVVLGDFFYVYPASAFEGFDLPEEAVRGKIVSRLERARPAAPADLARGAEVVDPDLPLSLVVEKGVASCEGTGGLKMLDLHPAVVYVPVQVLTFRYGKELFRLVVEELEGQPLSGQLPFRRDWGYLLGLPVVALLGYLAGLFLRGLGVVPAAEAVRLLFAPPILLMVGFFLLVATGLVSAALGVAWDLVRKPYVARITPAGLRLELAGESPPSPLQPVIDTVFGILKSLFEPRREEEPS